MEYTKTGNIYILRLEIGDLLIEHVETFAKEQGINTGILQGLGAVESVQLAFYCLDTKEYEPTLFNEPLEVTGLQGNITQYEGKPKAHIHMTVSNRACQAFGGHVLEAITGPTLELRLEALPITIERKLDEKIGLPLMNLK